MDSTHRDIHDRSPLLADNNDIFDDDREEPWNEADDSLTISPNSTSYLLLSSVGLAGLQIAWAIKYAGLLFYLLSLQIQKSTISLVWVFSPLIGAFVQCYVGMRSDSCRSNYGRRKPFLIGGVIGMAVLFLGLSWAQEIVEVSFPSSSGGHDAFLAIFSLLCVGSLDMVMNIVEASIRAYIMDVNLSSQQNAASAMAGVMLSVGNILGYVLGGFQLVEIVPSFQYHNAQFKLLSLSAVVAVTATIVVSLSTVTEPDPRRRFANIYQKKLSIASYVYSLPSVIRHLPTDIKKVCQVQILVWTGWFSFLFYSTTWVGEIWMEPFLQLNPRMSQAELDVLYANSSKVGNSAFILWSSSALFWGLLILWLTNTKSGMALLLSEEEVDIALGVTTKTVRRIWATSLAVLACFLLLTPMITSVKIAMVGMAAAGLPWAATMWAPFAIISNAVSSTAIVATIIDADDEDHSMNKNVPPSVDGGMALGVNALAMAIAQVMGSVVSAPIFHALQLERGQAGDASISISFSVLGCFVAGGVYLICSPWESDHDLDNLNIQQL